MPNDYPNGLFGNIQQTMMSPLFLGGAGMLTGGAGGMAQGFGSANQGLAYQEGQRKMGIEQQRAQDFQNLFANGSPDQFAGLPKGYVDMARVAGPDAGPAMIAKGYQGKMDLDTQGKLQAQSLALQFENAKKLAQFQQDQKFKMLDRMSQDGQAPVGAGMLQPQMPQPQPTAPQQMAPPRRAADGNMYVPDPNRPGKYLMVKP